MRKTTAFSAASAIAIAMTGAAHAQTPAPTPAAEDVVVTGSRISRAGFEAPTPLTTMQTTELAKKAPGPLADGLNQLPQFQNSVNSASRSTGTAAAQNTGNYLNMRALGTNRVLVLQDGQRMTSSGNNGSVDVSLVPSMLIERVDVVTGGASAVYGSDAVSGVVNFVINKRMEGVKLLAQGGKDTDSDFSSSRFGVAGGHSFLNDKVHIVGSAETYKTDPLQRRYIPATGEGWSLDRSGANAANAFQIVQGIRSGALSDQGIIIATPPPGSTTTALANNQFTSSGTLVPLNLGTPTSVAGVYIGGDGGYFSQTRGTTGSGQKMNQLFARAEVELGDEAVAFVSVGYNTSKYFSNPGGGFIRQIQIFPENPYLSGLTPAQRTALGTNSFYLGRIFAEGPGHDINQTSDSLVFNAEIGGTIANNYKWNLAVSSAKTTFESTQHDIEFSKFYAAADAVRDPSGNIVCRVLLDPNPTIRARYQGCQPMNPFGNGNVSQASYDYFWGTSRWQAENKMDSVEATLSGDLFQLPAGPLSFAVGAEYRNLSLDQTSNADPRIAIDYTGLRGVLPTQLLRFRLTNSGVATGSQDVKEAFGELNVPVFKDTAIGSLELNGAARQTDYSTSGQVTTWKVGGLFDPIDGVRFRATKSRDIRAPSLFELFGATQSTSQSFFDQLTQRNAGLQIITGGNANLKPEEADTLTAGIVLKPTFLPGFSFSVDFYNIEISKAIAAPFTAQQILDICFQSNYTSDVCNLVVRPLGPTNTSFNNFPSSILTISDNLAKQKVQGVDYEAAYGFDLGGGRVNLRGLATNMMRFNITNAVGQAERRLVGTADNAALPLPRWRGLADISYTKGPLTIGAQERYIGAFDRSHIQFYEQNRIPAYYVTDFNMAFKIPNKLAEFEAFTVVNNVFDKDAPLAPIAQASPGLTPPYYVNTYDIIGRFVTVGLRARF